MTTQPTMFGYSDTATRQGDLFAGRPVTVGLSCSECGRELVQTESGYGCCPSGCGRLLLLTKDDPADDFEHLPYGWPRQAAAIHERHAARDQWLQHEPCECGACNRARLDGPA